MLKQALLVFLLFSLCANSQNENLDYDLVTEKFINHYNNQQYDSIYYMFSSLMKKDVTKAGVQNYLRELRRFEGEIKDWKFEENRKPGEIEISILPKIMLKIDRIDVATYNINFGKRNFKLDIAIDENKKINEVSIRNPVDKTLAKNAINNISAKESLLSKKQKEIIFDKLKYFPNKTEFSIALIKNGVVNYYGVKRHNDSVSYKDNRKGVFEIGSISKVFTSNLLANFVLGKKLELDDYINDYIENPIKDSVLISFKSLANHTSGLPRTPNNIEPTDPDNPYKSYGIENLEIYLRDSLKVNDKQKGNYLYSNLGVGLIGHTLTKIENDEIDKIYDNYIFKKYNMLNTSFSAEKSKEFLVIGIDSQGNEVPNWDLSSLAAAGGILSNSEDLVKYAIANFDSSNKDLNMIRNQTFKINRKTAIGLGWFIINPKSEKNKFYTHSGNTRGYSSMINIDLFRKNGIILLSNVSAFNRNVAKINQLGFKLMKTLKNN